MKRKKFTLSGKPLEKQKEFFAATEKYVAYGGARGGGKSWALRRKIILMCLKYPGLSVLIIRRTFPELRENHIRPLMAELSGIASYTETRKTFEFANGSRIRMGYCDSEDDVTQYQGQEFDVIAIDEATQMSEYQFQTLKGALRGTNSFPKRMYLTCNPGGIGHAWVKRLFIDRDFREGENPSEYKFIPAKIFDNKILMKKNPDYLDQLRSLPENLKLAWLYGQWDVFAGQYFPEFDLSIHSMQPFFIDEKYLKYCAIDYGLDMLAAVFVAVSSSGEAFVYDEVYKSNLIVSDAASEILKKSDGVIQFIAPSDLWSRQKDSGKSIAELFSENGVFLSKLSSDRVQGWLCLKEWLKPVTSPDGTKTAKLRIFKNCTNLLRCLPLLMHDKNACGDVSTKPHEITHAPDALRYFAVSRSAGASLPKEPQRKKLAQILNLKQ